VGPRAGLDTEDTEFQGKILLSLSGIEPRSPGCPVRSQALYTLVSAGMKFRKKRKFRHGIPAVSATAYASKRVCDPNIAWSCFVVSSRHYYFALTLNVIAVLNYGGHSSQSPCSALTYMFCNEVRVQLIVPSIGVSEFSAGAFVVMATRGR
jgi:hypothetical protein